MLRPDGPFGSYTDFTFPTLAFQIHYSSYLFLSQHIADNKCLTRPLTLQSNCFYRLTAHRVSIQVLLFYDVEPKRESWSKGASEEINVHFLLGEKGRKDVWSFRSLK